MKFMAVSEGYYIDLEKVTSIKKTSNGNYHFLSFFIPREDREFYRYFDSEKQMADFLNKLSVIIHETES